MTGFFSTKELKVKTENGRNFTLLEPFTFTRPSTEVITVGAGAQSDGASIPEILWSTGLAPFGPWFRAAFLHDWLYRYTETPKDTANLILWEAMLAGGTPEETARIIYNAVRVGGGHAFTKDRQEEGRRHDVAG